jgi:flagellar biosynthesis/type III secretory pathway protein FliH
MSRLKKIPVILNTKIFSKLFNIAAISNLTKENYMKYEKDLMAYWDEYAIKKTIEHDLRVAKEEALKKGREEGREEGMEKGKAEVVKNLLSADKFSIPGIANFANVPETFVRKVKKQIK